MAGLRRCRRPADTDRSAAGVGCDLPHGARVRALRVGIGDPVTDQMVICTLRRNDLRGPTDQVMARVETTIPGTTTGTDVFVDSSIDHAVVDAKNHTRAVVCTLGADTKVAGAVVRYQLVDVATTTP